MYTYKTKDGNDITLVGVGTTVNGQIESESKIENPNLQLVSDSSAEAPSQNHVQGVTPQSAQGSRQVNGDEQSTNGGTN
jgi:hypothetical protein